MDKPTSKAGIYEKTKKKSKNVKSLQIPQSDLLPHLKALRNPKKRHFLEIYYLCDGNVTKACKAAKISRPTYYHWRSKDKVFASYLKEKQEQLNDEMKQTLIDRARDKTGKTELIFYLKNRHPEFQSHKETLAMSTKDGDKEVRFVLSRG